MTITFYETNEEIGNLVIKCTYDITTEYYTIHCWNKNNLNKVKTKSWKRLGSIPGSEMDQVDFDYSHKIADELAYDFDHKYLIAAFDQQGQIVEQTTETDKHKMEKVFLAMDYKYNRFPVGVYEETDGIYKRWCTSPYKKFYPPKEVTVPTTKVIGFYESL